MSNSTIPVMSYQDILQLPPEELEKVGFSLIGTNTALNLSPFILGLFFDCVFFGVVAVQASRWIQYCHGGEKWPMRALVVSSTLIAFLSSLDPTLYSPFGTGSCFSTLPSPYMWNFELFVYQFGWYRQFVSLEYASYFYLVDSAIRFPVSGFFGLRAWRMSKRNPFLGATLVLLLVGSCVIGVAAKVLSTTTYGLPSFSAMIYTWLSIHLTSDLIATVTIGIAFFKSKTGWSHTDQLINRLLLMTAETQLPPTMMSTAFLIVYIVLPGSTWPIFFVFGGKVFAMCFLAVLNTKYTLRQELQTDPTAHQEYNSYAMKSRNRTAPVVHVVTETYREQDDYDHIPDKKQQDDVESLSPRVENKDQSLVEFFNDSEATRVRFI